MNSCPLLGTGACAALTPSLAIARTPVTDYRRLLVLVELKGGNDGLNTIVPFADPRYAQLRPRIGLRRDELLLLDERTGAHPSLAPLRPLGRPGAGDRAVGRLSGPTSRISARSRSGIPPRAATSTSTKAGSAAPSRRCRYRPTSRPMASSSAAAISGPLVGAARAPLPSPVRSSSSGNRRWHRRALRRPAGRSATCSRSRTMSRRPAPASAAAAVHHELSAGAFGDAVR